MNWHLFQPQRCLDARANHVKQRADVLEVQAMIPMIEEYEFFRARSCYGNSTDSMQQMLQMHYERAEDASILPAIFCNLPSAFIKRRVVKKYTVYLET